MHASILLAASVLATVASAQNGSTTVTASTTVSQSMPASATSGFNAALVSSTDKSAWCTSELNTCPMICGGFTSTNTCDADTLTYACICSNGTEPDVTAYEGTLPFFICQATYAQCIANNPNDLDAQTTCKNDEKCGTLNATASSTSSAAASSATSTSGSTASSTATSTSSSSSSSKSGSAATSLNTELATGAFAGLLLAVFKLLL